MPTDTDAAPDTERSPPSRERTKRQKLIEVLELAAAACGCEIVRCSRASCDCVLGVTSGNASALEREVLHTFVGLIRRAS